MGERKLAYVVRIDEVNAHPNADRLELCQVGGWTVIAGKDSFRPSDVAIYAEIDSIIPESLVEGRPEKEQLEKRKYKIKTIKLRGEISQGILFPLELVQNVGEVQGNVLQLRDGGTVELQEGVDLTAALGITKHDDGDIPGPSGGGKRSTFPTHLIPKTDEARVQNLRERLQQWHGMQFYAAEKVDGCSFTYIRQEQTTIVASRNHEVADCVGNVYWQITHKCELDRKLAEAGLDNIGLQGEIIGPKIQGNRYGLDQYDVYFFNVFHVVSKQFMNGLEACKLIESLGLKWVPIVEECITLAHTSQQLVKMAEGKSKLNSKTEREGLVFRPLEEAADSRRISFKAISNKFLLKHDS